MIPSHLYIALFVDLHADRRHVCWNMQGILNFTLSPYFWRTI